MPVEEREEAPTALEWQGWPVEPMDANRDAAVGNGLEHLLDEPSRGEPGPDGDGEIGWATMPGPDRGGARGAELREGPDRGLDVTVPDVSDHPPSQDPRACSPTYTSPR